MKLLLPAILTICLISCNGSRHINFDHIALEDLSGQKVNIGTVTGNGIAVFVFMSPDCPLCINYTKTITELRQQFLTNGVTFIPVYSGEYNSKAEIIEFQKDYNFEIRGLLDPEYKLASVLKATVTPEAIVISSTGEKIYSGAIDNWMYETGRKRPSVTKKYLETALKQLLNGQDPDPAKTEPVGCLLEI